MIRDRDAVGVPREIVQHVGGAAEGRLGVHHPRLAIERPEKGAKGDVGGERLERPESEPPVREARRAARHEFAAKDLPEHLDGEKEGRPRVDPPRTIRRQPAGRHDAVDVGMVLQPLAPRMEDHEPADRGAETLRVRGDLEQRARRPRGKRRSYTTRLLTSASRASSSGIVKTTCT